MPYDIERWRECAESLSQCGRELAALGWTPATSSNFSQRIDAHYIAITISGRDKGRLGVDDIMVVDLDGAAVGSDHRPSAETRLHTQLYARDPALGCVLHTHSHHQTVASRLFAAEGKVRLAGYELLKAFRGFDTHDTELDLPVFANSQDMEVLSAAVERWLSESETAQTRGGQPVGSAYLIDGHGLYAWGRDMAETRRHLDAMEFLLGCSLDLRRLQA